MTLNGEESPPIAKVPRPRDLDEALVDGVGADRPLVGRRATAAHTDVPLDTARVPTSRYAIRSDEHGRYLSCVETPNLAVRLDRSLCVAAANARKYAEGTIFLDGAAQSEPFMDVQRKVYNLDHHEGCVRAFTLATCEQTLVMILKGLDLRSGDWNVYGNEPDLDTVLAIWLLLNHKLVGHEDPSVRRQMAPLVRLQGVIDAHGLELRELAALPEDLLEETQETIDQLRAEEVELKQDGRWSGIDPLEYTVGVLKEIDALVEDPGVFSHLHDIEELVRVPIAPDRIAVLCRAEVGVYEVEQQLRKVHGDRVGMVILRKDPQTYTLRQSDSFMPVTLEPFYDRLNTVDPAVGEGREWGGSSEIGGSPRGYGTGLGHQDIAAVCSWVYRPPTARFRLRRTGEAVAVAVAGVLFAVVGAFAGLPTGGLGLAAGTDLLVAGIMGSLLLAAGASLTAIGLRGRFGSLFGWRRHTGWGWLGLLPVLFVAGALGGAWAAIPGSPTEHPAWIVALVPALGACGFELLLRGAVHGRMATVFRIPRPAGAWFLSVPNLVAAAIGATIVVLLLGAAPWLIPLAALKLRLLLAWMAALAAGLVCGLARERWGSLAAPVVLHAAVAAGLGLAAHSLPWP